MTFARTAITTICTGHAGQHLNYSAASRQAPSAVHLFWPESVRHDAHEIGFDRTRRVVYKNKFDPTRPGPMRPRPNHRKSQIGHVFVKQEGRYIWRHTVPTPRCVQRKLRDSKSLTSKMSVEDGDDFKPPCRQITHAESNAFMSSRYIEQGQNERCFYVWPWKWRSKSWTIIILSIVHK